MSLRGSHETHLVVVKDGEPFAAYPDVDGDLAGRPELQGLSQEMLYDPPPAKLPRHARRGAKRRGAAPLAVEPGDDLHDAD